VAKDTVRVSASECGENPYISVERLKKRATVSWRRALTNRNDTPPVEYEQLNIKTDNTARGAATPQSL
jgi:hypothetical protein